MRPEGWVTSAHSGDNQKRNGLILAYFPLLLPSVHGYYGSLVTHLDLEGIKARIPNSFSGRPLGPSYHKFAKPK